jgi:hypothetical protein
LVAKDVAAIWLDVDTLTTELAAAKKERDALRRDADGLREDLRETAMNLLRLQRAGMDYAEVYVRVGERHMVTSVTKEELEMTCMGKSTLLATNVSNMLKTIDAATGSDT